MKTLLITSTDTNAGKTIITAGLRAYYQEYYPNLTIGLMKLIQTGDDSSTISSDVKFYEQFFTDVVNPLSFNAPLAPPIAAMKENKTVNLATVWQSLLQLQAEKDLVLAEALGGLGSPVTFELTVADLASSWRLETILVVSVKLGAIAQIVANVALARQHKIKLRGIILNCIQPYTEAEIEDLTPIELIQTLTQVPVLGIFPYVNDVNDLISIRKGITQLDLSYLNLI